MADPAAPDRGALPPLTPQSRRIHAASARFGVARVLGASRNPLPAFESIDTSRPPIVVLKEEHLISRVAAKTRPMDRPADVEEWIDVCTAQFFLRNTHRATRDDVRPDAMEFTHTPAPQRARYESLRSSPLS